MTHNKQTMNGPLKSQFASSKFKHLQEDHCSNKVSHNLRHVKREQVKQAALWRT